ncbi:MAG TPA: hypothetical protein QGH18_06250, partial [Arenicellales bacterium]|nr:hypothetical protein [Arenicellales bacterium]
PSKVETAQSRKKERPRQPFAYFPSPNTEVLLDALLEPNFDTEQTLAAGGCGSPVPPEGHRKFMDVNK